MKAMRDFNMIYSGVLSSNNDLVRNIPLHDDVVWQKNAICIWSFSMDQKTEYTYSHALHEQEKERSNLLKNENIRRQMRCSRGVLRIILSNYLQQLPSLIELQQNRYGRLSVTNAGFDFNVSHSADQLMIGVNHQGKIGVDIEKMRDVLNIENFARRFFSDNETDWILSAPEDMRRRHFFSLWTIKEAVLKAVGVGVSEGSKHVQLDDLLSPTRAFYLSKNDVGNNAVFDIHTWSVKDDIMAAVAYENNQLIEKK